MTSVDVVGEDEIVFETFKTDKDDDDDVVVDLRVAFDERVDSSFSCVP